MAYNKFFFEIDIKNKKEGSVFFQNKNNKLSLTENLFFKDNYNGFITSSNNSLLITSSLYIKNNLTSSNLKSNRISFDIDDNLSIHSNLSNVLNFNSRCEATGSTKIQNKIISTGITGSLTEVSPGRSLILGRNGVSVEKILDQSSGKHYFDISIGDSNNLEESSPINTTIYLKITGNTPTLIQSGIQQDKFNSIKNSFLQTNGNNHYLLVHDFYDDIFLGEKLLFFVNLTEADDNTEVNLDFTWSASPGTNNKFFIGNIINCSLFLKPLTTQKVKYIFDNFDGTNKNKYEFLKDFNTRVPRWSDATTVRQNNQLIINRDSSFNGSSESICYVGKRVNTISNDNVVFYDNYHLFDFV